MRFCEHLASLRPDGANPLGVGELSGAHTGGALMARGQVLATAVRIHPTSRPQVAMQQTDAVNAESW